MGERDATRVDAAALHAAAHQYESAARLVDTAVRTHLNALTFDGAAAGRAHTVRGEALRAAVDDVVAPLRQWSRAAAEIAVLLRLSADRYTDVDAAAARRVG
ncbi:ESX-1 secretion-associated protein [Mycobacterium manitobense]|uniref:ESX-1 secretion-associated protein n=1 Tax=[Mycobacterium] manitobense TaxID=190147 RepID=A0A9X2YJN7_9MYCO|nr:type VII secretion target [[Mycobacterium] manitobense]MCV7168984.1 ESX-1 secretion-associated protein [[Mycobacterium] manitobense]